MTLMIQITLAAALILSILVPFGAFFLGEKNKKRYKRSLACNCFFFFGSLLIGTIVMFGGTVSAQAATSADTAGLAELATAIPEPIPERPVTRAAPRYPRPVARPAVSAEVAA